MPCSNCKVGRCFQNWDNDWVCLQCGRAAYLAPVPAFFLNVVALAKPTAPEAKRRPRGATAVPKLTSADVAAIRQRFAGAKWGTKSLIARQIATELGVSAVYVGQIARGEQRAG